MQSKTSQTRRYTQEVSTHLRSLFRDAQTPKSDKTFVVKSILTPKGRKHFAKQESVTYSAIKIFLKTVSLSRQMSVG